MDNHEENQLEPSGSGFDESVGQVEEPMASAETDLPEAFEERRGFIKFFCAFIGTLISLMPFGAGIWAYLHPCLLYTSPSPRDRQKSRMPSSA